VFRSFDREKNSAIERGYRPKSGRKEMQTIDQRSGIFPFTLGRITEGKIWPSLLPRSSE